LEVLTTLFSIRRSIHVISLAWEQTKFEVLFLLNMCDFHVIIKSKICKLGTLCIADGDKLRTLR
jgi:hypothetical protein